MIDDRQSPTIEHFASRLATEHATLARSWLERLDALLVVETQQVFPTHQLLDHIPELILEIAEYLRAPTDQNIIANTAVMAKAAELGLLRFDQHASVHQLLREYQIFSDILDAFFTREANDLGPGADAAATVLVVSRAHEAVRVLQQATVDTFVGRFTEAIERQHAQLRSFSRLVSHEVRQPLGVLQVVAKTLRVPAEDDDGLRLQQTLERNVVRLGEVAGKLELLARLTKRSDNAPNEQQVNLSSLAADVARQLGDMASARGVTIQIDPRLPTLFVDTGRVELVMVNLLANAIKYSDPHKPARVVWVELDATDSACRIRIRDNGIGIPASKLSVIFDQFVRAHAHLDDGLGAQGLGLGLSIVRESMEAMGGRASVESVEQEGTTFTLDWSRSTCRRAGGS